MEAELKKRMDRVVAGMPDRPKSARIRKLKLAGFRQADIARFENVLDQYMSNIARTLKPEPEGKPANVEFERFELQMAADGRVVVPAGIREAMGVKEGGKLFARLEDGELRLCAPETATRKLRALIRKYVPSGVSLSEELIKDRRREAEQDDGA